LGVKLGLKSSRCASPKCALIRKPYAPGVHKNKSFRRKVSEYGTQLAEKQKIRFTYGLTDGQLRRVFEAANAEGKSGAEGVLDLLERRLDSVVYGLGLADGRRRAKQLISHGHFWVNGRKVTNSSFLLREGDEIRVRPESADFNYFKVRREELKNYEPPVWLSLDKDEFKGKVVGRPKEVVVPFDINLVVDYYA